MESAPEKSLTQKAERSERAASGSMSVSEIPGANELLRIPRLAGNMAMQRLLRSGALRAKLTVGAPNDIYEQEADRVADTVLLSAPSGVAQRKCGCGGSASNAEEVCTSCAEAQKIQTKPNGSHQQAGATTGIVGVNGFGRGRPLDSEIRSFMEARFNRDFRDVRVHTDPHAAASAASINARAFTLNNDVVFAEGQYTPASTDGKRLLAHELTHVVQQGQAQRSGVIRRQTAGETPAGSATPTPQPAKSNALIVDDSTADVEPHQMKRSAFLGLLRAAVAATIAQTLSSVPFGFSFLADITQQAGQQFSQYSGLDARSLESLARTNVPSANGATSASALIPMICTRVRQAVEEYVVEMARKSVARAEELGGNVGDVIGSGVGGVFGGALGSTVGSAVGSTVGSDLGSAVSTVAGLLFKANEGGPRKPDDPRAIRGQLRSGQPLDSRLQSGLSAVYGQDLSGVRIHSDTTAARLASQFNARAFTYGQDIAFNFGEYKPGTLFGDALIAHELAHVAQQRGHKAESVVLPKDNGSDEAFENDADMAAVGAMVSLWGGFKGDLSRIVQRTGPSLRSGLKLRRCEAIKGLLGIGKKTEETPDAGPTPTSTPTPTQPPPPPPPKTLQEELKDGTSRQQAVDKVVGQLKIDRELVSGGVYKGTVFAAAFAHTIPAKGNQKPKIEVFEPAFKDGWALLASTIFHEYQHVLNPLVSEAAGEVEAYCKEIVTAEERGLHKEVKIEVPKEEKKKGTKALDQKIVEMSGKDYITQELWKNVNKNWARLSEPEKRKLQSLYNEAKTVVQRLSK